MMCDECKFLDAHGVDVLTIGCLACGGETQCDDYDPIGWDASDAYRPEDFGDDK